MPDFMIACKPESKIIRKTFKVLIENQIRKKAGFGVWGGDSENRNDSEKFEKHFFRNHKNYQKILALQTQKRLLMAG